MSQIPLFMQDKKLVSLKEASLWASQYLKRNITVSNISYLIQYGRIQKHGINGTIFIDIDELKQYYDSKVNSWKEKLGDDLNWHLSFEKYKESERTKHVHRLHPYKGKFIPQLVEYFLDSHIDEFKKKVYFKKRDIILDPFCGSGTTLVQANESGIHAIGIDISTFNTLISNAKIAKYNLYTLKQTLEEITSNLNNFVKSRNNKAFEEELLYELNKFNKMYFPAPIYRKMISKKEIDEDTYAYEKEKYFIKIYNDLVKKYKIKIKQDQDHTFLDKWFLHTVREEIDFMISQLENIKDNNIKQILSIILSRTIRSCRATTHADLATLKDPVITTYYCKKHGKICKPIFSIQDWWLRYTKDTLKRLNDFDKIRTDTFQISLTGDSRTIDIYKEIKKINPDFADLLQNKKIKGIFTSPPYVGLIDYHEQHAYAYELFKFPRKDMLEIGALSKGTGKVARDAYVKGIVETLLNCKKYLHNDYDIFIVANDKYNLYPEIAKLSNMKIINQFKRPVLNRAEKDRSNAYSETIFHMKEK